MNISKVMIFILVIPVLVYCSDKIPGASEVNLCDDCPDKGEDIRKISVIDIASNDEENVKKDISEESDVGTDISAIDDIDTASDSGMSEYCECIKRKQEQNHFNLCTYTYKKDCKTAYDCCVDVPEPYICNQDYPYIFKCEDGFCKNADCVSNEQCNRFYEEMVKSGPFKNFINHGCEEKIDECTGYVHRNCTYIFRKECKVDSDCCGEVPSPYICNEDFPHIWRCESGFCKSIGCDDDRQCDKYYNLRKEWGLFEDYINEGCKYTKDECTGEVYANCTYTYKKECKQDSDCCVNVPKPYICNEDYPYLYKCENGYCKTADCTDNQQCEKYYNEMKKLDSFKYYVNEGCKRY